MASSDFWQRLSSSLASSSDRESGLEGAPSRASRGTSKLWMTLDVVTVLAAASLITLYVFHTNPMNGARAFWRGTLFFGRPMWVLLAFLCGFTFVLIVTSRRLHLYTPRYMTNILNEQRLSAQACFTSGLLLTGTLYLFKATYVPRGIVVSTVVLIALALGLRRLVYRLLLYRRFSRGIDTRNVLLVGTGVEAQALRMHLDTLRHLGYTFKGFVEMPGTNPCEPFEARDVVGSLETLFQQVRKNFIDEIIFTTPCDRSVVENVLERAREHGVDLRILPELYSGVPGTTTIEYIGQFPTIPLHRGKVPEIGLVFKRVFDTVFSLLMLIVISPVLLAIAIAIKIDSPGPVFYASERIGKKGVVFRCFKFRTMVRDADKRRAEILHMNERDDVLFKVSNDPRITRVGRFLRKYSLDELPQFINVIRGEMSIVGPRPPLAGEVSNYDLKHLRRLDVIPGITGLWQVQARQDPSFASYVSLDVSYIENWSLWLDFKIILRTIGVVFAGTGT